MAEQYDNTNRGILWPNDRKEKETQPDHKGTLNVEGKEYWISGWEKTTSKGEAISLSVQLKEESTGRNSEAWSNARDKLKKPDVVVEEVSDEPINLDDIPFN